MTQSPPYLRGYPILGMLPKFIRNPLQTSLDIAQMGDVVAFHFLGKKAYALHNPDYIKYVLEVNQRNYHKSQIYEKIHAVLGRGLVTSEGELWLRQRRLMQPTFRQNQVRNLAGAIVATTARHIERLVQSKQDVVDIAEKMAWLTLEIITQMIFGSAQIPSVARLCELWNALHELAATRFVDLPRWLPSPQNHRYWRTLAELDAIIYQLIGDRRKMTEAGEDLLATLLSAAGEIDESLMRDEIATMLFAGHETSSSALAWTWYLLAHHPQVEEKLHSEVATVLQGELPTVEKLAELPYCHMVLCESMRLYPPVYAISRCPIAADEIGGYEITADSLVFMSQYALHRDPRYWDCPQQFRPERFAPEEVATRHRYCYFPFAGGGRVCIGNHLAMLEMQIILCMMAQRFRAKLVTGHPVEPIPLVTLKPHRGILVHLRQRTDT